LNSDNLLSDLPLKVKNASILEEETITKKFYNDYSYFKKELFEDISQLNDGLEGVSKLQLYKKTQKLLDRFLFIFFAEDRGLLPPNSISRMIKRWNLLKDEDAYKPLYDIYKQYFGYMNEGRKGKIPADDIHEYNGGLFLPDELLDSIKIDDDILLKHTSILTNYDFDSQVDVNILGHIFEHSLNEIESTTAELEGVDFDKQKSKRKKDGVFYTPKYITKYIVDNTVGKLCEEKKVELGIIDDEYIPNRKKDTKRKLLGSLESYRSWLLELTICDPACGSGAFLNQALEFLINEHHYIDQLNAQLFGSAMVFQDVENQILEKNIFGVDINEESVDIARLSLWLRTAQRGRKLTTLNKNIKCGNSLIDDPEVAGEKAFNWEKEFPAVFANGGFDVVIGNPPWGAKIPKYQKNYVNSRYWCNTGEIETYVHFTELGISLLLKTNGILGLITPNTWYYLDKYEKLRVNIMCSQVIELIELEKRIFVDAPDIVPAIFFIRCSDFVEGINITTYKLRKGHIPSYLIDNTIFSKFSIDTKDWIQFEHSPFNLSLTTNVAILLKKLQNDSIRISSKYNVRYGIKTGNNKKYVSRIIEAQKGNWKKCASSANSIKRYELLWNGDWLNYGEYLAGYSKNSFEHKKILIQYIRKLSMDRRLVTSLDTEGQFYPLNNFSFIEEKGSNSLEYLIGILNSKLMNYYFKNVHIDYNIKPKYIEKLPLKLKSNNLESLTKQIKALLVELNLVSRSLTNLIKSKFTIESLSKKLQNWYEFEFGTFLQELKKAKVKLSLSEEAEWMEYFNEQKQKAQAIKVEIDCTDKEIDQMVYELYELTEEEIKIVEQN
jgi:hypothetical protein